MADPVVALIDMLEDVEEALAIGVILEYRFLFVPPGSDVINGSGVFYAKRTGHGGTIAEKQRNAEKVDLTLWGLAVRRKRGECQQ